MKIGTSLSDAAPGLGALDGLSSSIAAAATDGFASGWLANIFALEAMTSLAVAGRGTTDIELGTAVVPTYPRHPAVMAQQALTTQLALGGRFVLGIGLSHQIVIEAMYGYAYDKPARHMREYLQVLLPLLRGEGAKFRGETVSANIGIGVPTEPRTPVLLAAMAPRMLALAGAEAEGTLLWMTGPQTIADHVVPLITEAADKAGRDAPRVVAALPICVTNDKDAARARANEVFAVYGDLPSYRAMLDKEGAAGPGDVALVGSEDEVTEQVAGLAEAGVTDFTAAEFGADEDGERTRALLRTLNATYNT